MKARIIRMRFTAPLHLGTREAVQETTLDYIPSDLLFSALCNMYRLMYGNKELEEFISIQEREKKLRLSSAFPYLNDTYFLPRPFNFDLSIMGWERKKAKRVRYIDYDIFCHIAEGSLEAEHLNQYIEQPVDGALFPVEYKGLRIKYENEVPRIALDSITGASNIYYFHQVSFARNAGLYCLADCDDNIWHKVMACFRLMGDEGIGGDRSSGRGSFTVDFPGEMAFPDIKDSEAHVLLSLYYPADDEVRDLKGEYNLIKRAGYMYSPNEMNQRRQTVRMLTEASVLYSSKRPKGTIIDITPPGFTEHRVLRNGLAFSIPLVYSKGGTGYGW